MRYFDKLLVALFLLATSHVVYADQSVPYNKEMLSKYKSSFDCSRVTTEVERKICANELLSQLDGLLANTYKSRQSPRFGLDQKRFRQAQLSWLKERNKCQDVNCIRDKYKQRLNELCDLPVITGVKFEEDCDLLVNN